MAETNYNIIVIILVCLAFELMEYILLNKRFKQIYHLFILGDVNGLKTYKNFMKKAFTLSLRYHKKNKRMYDRTCINLAFYLGYIALYDGEESEFRAYFNALNDHVFYKHVMLGIYDQDEYKLNHTTIKSSAYEPLTQAIISKDEQRIEKEISKLKNPLTLLLLEKKGIKKDGSSSI